MKQFLRPWKKKQNKMNILRNILILLFGFTFTAIYSQEVNDSISLQNEINDSSFYELQYPDYVDWDKVSLQGKLKMEGLPLSPTVKVFMQKDSLISMSIRAPFIGEAARIDITPDVITAVNKMNKTYVQENIEEFLKYYPGDISDLQDLLLARFFLPGYNVSEITLDDLIDIYYEDNQYNVIPKGEAEIDGIKYGFVVDSLFNPLMLIVLPEENPDIELTALYDYKSRGYDLILNYQEGERIIAMDIEFKEPEWKGDIPKDIDLDKKYRKLSFGEFINSF